MQPNDDKQTREARRFTVSTARLSLAAMAVLAVLAFWFVSEAAAQGVLLGGVAGVLGIWTMAARIQRLSTIAPEKLHAAMIAGTYLRMILYAVFLYIAYRVDPAGLQGFFGALAALLTVRFVPIYLALARARGGGSRSRSPGAEDR